MWTCSKCSEQIEDQFDSCWSCATKRLATAPDPSASQPASHQLRGEEKFWHYWKRGWWVWLMMLCVSLGHLGVLLVVLLPLALVFPPLRQSEDLFHVAVFVVLLLVGSPVNYLVFVWFLGEDESPATSDSPEETAARLYRWACKLEVEGNFQAALAAHQDVVERFGNTQIAKDAQICIANLRSRLG